MNLQQTIVKVSTLTAVSGLPGRVVVETKGSSVGVVVSLEVLHDHQVDSLGICRVAAGISHAAASILEVIPHDERQLPEAGE